MKLDQWRYFLAVAQTRHLGMAAKAVHVTSSALSHSIRGLEDELGCQLFEKDGRNIRLTAAGQVAALRMGGLIREMEAVHRDLGRTATSLRGFYRVAASHDLAAGLVATAWNQLSLVHPDLKGELISARSGEVREVVLNGTSDFGVCFGAQKHHALAMQLLRAGDIHIVCRREHPILALRGSAWPAALAQYPAVMPKPVDGIEPCERHPALQRLEIVPDVRLRSDSYTVVTEILNASDLSHPTSA